MLVFMFLSTKRKNLEFGFPTKINSIIFILCILTNFVTQAQSLSSVCEDWIKKAKYDKALECYEKQLTEKPKDQKALIRIAEIYYKLKDKSKALEYVNKVIDINPNEAYSPILYLANKMNDNGDNDWAVLMLNRLSVSNLDSSKSAKAEAARLKFTIKSHLDRNAIPGVLLSNMGNAINSAENEYLPTLSLDGNTLVFTRNTGGNEDFFISQKTTSGQWGSARNLGYPPNTHLPEGGAMLSADGNYLFYTRCDMRSPDGIKGGGCDIVFSYRVDSLWSTPEYFGYTINTTAYEGQPCLSSNLKDLYFVSDREGGYGGKDIWVSHFENNLWSKPENLGPLVNTSKDESSPFIHPDNESLYFSSNGHFGLGGNDIFLCRKNKNGTWKSPINLGSPINTDKFDGSIVINAKGTVGYLASDRADSKGGLDIYSFSLHDAIKPMPTICLKGTLVDKYFKTKLFDKPIRILNASSNQLIEEINSNEGDASYARALHLGKKYLIHVPSENEVYRPFYKLIDLTRDTLPENYFVDFKLRMPGLKDTLYKTTLRYDTLQNRFDVESVAQIDSIVTNWTKWNQDSAFISVFVKGYFYCCDSLYDSLYLQRLEASQAKIDLFVKSLERKGIACKYVMPQLDMLIYNDEEDFFNQLDVFVLEDY